jgi:hypothetical protein
MSDAIDERLRKAANVASHAMNGSRDGGTFDVCAAQRDIDRALGYRELVEAARALRDEE